MPIVTIKSVLITVLKRLVNDFNIVGVVYNRFCNGDFFEPACSTNFAATPLLCVMYFIPSLGGALQVISLNQGTKFEDHFDVICISNYITHGRASGRHIQDNGAVDAAKRGLKIVLT